MNNPKPGLFYIDAITLVNQEGESIDLRNIMMNFSLFESVYESFCTAQLNIIDGIDLKKHFKLTGQEHVRVAIRMNEGDGKTTNEQDSIDKVFRIYKISDVNRKGITDGYTIHLIDPRAFFCLKKRISQVFRGSYNTILQNILVKHAHISLTEFDYFEKTQPDNIQFISPNWNVKHLIDFCVENAEIENVESYKSSMFFFQTLNGGFRFMGIDEMFKREHPVTFNNNPRGDIDLSEVHPDSPLGANTHIKNFTISQDFDTLQGTGAGAYASQLRVYNPIFKMEEEATYDLQETYGKGHMDNFPILRLAETDNDYFDDMMTTDNPTELEISPDVITIDSDLAPNKAIDSRIVYETKMVHPFDDRIVTEDEQFHGFNYDYTDGGILHRNSMREIIQQHRMEVIIPLRTDLTVGTMVNLEISPAEETPSQHPYKSSRYLVLDMRIIGAPSQNQGEMILGVCKESFTKKIQDVDSLSDAEPARTVI